MAFIENLHVLLGDFLETRWMYTIETAGGRP